MNPAEQTYFLGQRFVPEKIKKEFLLINLQNYQFNHKQAFHYTQLYTIIGYIKKKNKP